MEADGAGPLVDATWLAARIGDPDVQVVDCRFVLGRPGAGRAAHRVGHVPGAVFLDLDDDLSGPPGTGPAGPVGGRHPLPEPGALQAALRRVGLRAGAHVVAYDEAMSGGAARLWWLLRHHGHARASVLHGGLAGWPGPLEAGAPDAAPGDIELGPPREDDVIGAGVLAVPDPGRLVLDARAPARFRGDDEPVDPVAGHIPGARNLPLAEAFPPPRALVSAGEELVASCGSGVTACGLVLAFAAAGRDDVRLYPGSWSDWVARGLPVATGPG